MKWSCKHDIWNSNKSCTKFIQFDISSENFAKRDDWSYEYFKHEFLAMNSNTVESAGNNCLYYRLLTKNVKSAMFNPQSWSVGQTTASLFSLNENENNLKYDDQN